MPTSTTAKVQLEQQLARLLERAGKIEADLRQSHNSDWTEQAIELENDPVLEGLDDLTLAEVKQIRDALGRIRDNTYGTCAMCGRPISDARLAAIPSATVCIDCVAKQRS